MVLKSPLLQPQATSSHLKHSNPQSYLLLMCYYLDMLVIYRTLMLIFKESNSLQVFPTVSKKMHLA